MSASKDKKRGTWKIYVRYRDWQGKIQVHTKRGFETKREAQEYERVFLLQKSSDLNARFHTIISERDYYKGRSDDLGIVEKSMGINRVQSIIRESKEAQERETIIAKVEKKHQITL